MAASNVTIDDTSSLFEYAPADAWAHDSGNDAQSYVNSTFSRTTVEGATAKFSFEGTAFWLYGAKKAEYGEYILIVDDTVSTYASATADGSQFEQVLGGASGLENKKHTVVLMAAGGGPVDIDAIMYETTNQDEIKAASGDASARISATPNAVNEQDPNQSSAQTSATPGVDGQPAAPTDGVQNAPTDVSQNAPTDGLQNAPTDGPAGAPVDGQQPPTDGQGNTTTDGQPNGPTDGQPPASTDGQSTAPTNGQPPSPDDAQNSAPLNGQANADASPAPTAAQSAPQSASTTSGVLPPNASQAELNGPQIAGTSQMSGGLPLAAIIGIAVGAAVLLLLILFLVWFCLRRRKAKARRQRDVALPSPILPLQNPDTEGGYFFGGRGGGPNPMRDKYLAQQPQAMSQPYGPGATFSGRASPYAGSGLRDMPRPMAPGAYRDSTYTDTATLVSMDGTSDITDMYSKLPPTRPARPPELRLSVV